MSSVIQRGPASAEKPEAKPTAYSDASLPAFTPPKVTIKEIYGAIPAHCLERSALRSSLYIVQDYTTIACLYYLASYIDGYFGTNGTVLSGYAGVAAKWTAWTAYWYFCGLAMTGSWIVAHECGHQAFSPSKTINNAVGLVLHSALFVPYHSWRISHGRHHAATSHMDREEVYVPHTRSSKIVDEKKPKKKVTIGGLELEELVDDAPLYRLGMLLAQQLLGWPLYLTMNASGQSHYPKWTNHFDPNAIIFDKRHRRDVIVSDIGLIICAAIASWSIQTFGWANFVKFYFIPYLCTNHWLIMITYLQHTDPTLPHYRAGQWNFQRGALCTMDRNLMGPVGPYMLHGICETHVAHHLNSKIPHYHAWEVTEALKPLLGEHYRSTDENMFVSLWNVYRQCQFVDDDGDVVFFRDKYGRAERKVVYEGASSDSGL